MTIARVFVDDAGKFGNPVGIVVDEALDFSHESRQKMTYESGLSEVVFIDNLSRGVIHIYSPLREIPFAGHAVIGATSFITRELGHQLTSLMGTESPIKTWEENGLTWASCSLDILPPWELVQHASAKEIEKLKASEIGPDAHALHWAWHDEPKGIVRARTFAPGWGIVEDEANGSGSMLLAHNVKQSLTVLHGKGSIIFAQPSKRDMVQVGGRVCIV